ncbi:MAG: hypothetical protein GX258_09020 [Clostridiales bacterium]|nr:hypothetical protein [Clostridiales bacterium]
MKRFNRIISLLTLATMLVSNIPKVTHAISDHGNSGSGSQGGASGGSFTWVEAQAGYRVYLVSKDMDKVSNTVGILFSKHLQDLGVFILLYVPKES